MPTPAPHTEPSATSQPATSQHRTDAGQRSLAEIGAAVASDAALLSRQRAELARSSGLPGRQGDNTRGGLFAGAGLLGYLAVFMLLVAAAEGPVALGLLRWVSYLLVALTLVLVAAVLALLGRRWWPGLTLLPAARRSLAEVRGELTVRTGSSGPG